MSVEMLMEIYFMEWNSTNCLLSARSNRKSQLLTLKQGMKWLDVSSRVSL